MKKASLNLSINAVVVIVLAITMLGLGLAFMRGVFSGGLANVEDQLRQLNEQRVNALMEDCNEEVCLELRKVDIRRNGEKDIWMAINNKFDCDLQNSGTDSAVSVTIGGQAGGTGDLSCTTIGGVGDCDDISVQSRAEKDVLRKSKDAILVRIKAGSSAETTVYSYDIELFGECSGFELDEKVTLDVNVVG